MPRDGTKTKTRILDETTKLVLQNGFAGTTIDHILERTSLTKGAFFYHFKSKSHLAHELMQHFANDDARALEISLEYANANSKTARGALMSLADWFVNEFSGLESPYPGCLYASYIYEPEQFTQEVKDMVRDAILMWREALSDLIRKTAEESPPVIEVNHDALADMLTVILEGAFIVSKALNEAGHTADQLKEYRKYLELIFPAPEISN